MMILALKIVCVFFTFVLLPFFAVLTLEETSGEK